MRKYVKTLGRLTALTAAGTGATVFMGRTRALEVGERQWGGSAEDDHELGNRQRSGACTLWVGIVRTGQSSPRSGQRQPARPSLAPFVEEIVNRLRHCPADARHRDEV